jgi:competence protein ComEC
VSDTKEFASLVILLHYKNFSLLLTGDSQKAELTDAAASMHDLTVLQVSHHGSATGIDTVLAKKLSPRLAVISVGSKNRYGFPTLVTLASLREASIPVLRTDLHGTISVATDGVAWHVN